MEVATAVTEAEQQAHERFERWAKTTGFDQMGWDEFPEAEKRYWRLDDDSQRGRSGF